MTKGEKRAAARKGMTVTKMVDILMGESAIEAAVQVAVQSADNLAVATRRLCGHCGRAFTGKECDRRECIARERERKTRGMLGMNEVIHFPPVRVRMRNGVPCDEVHFSDGKVLPYSEYMVYSKGQQ